MFVFMPYEMIELGETSLGKLFFASIIVYYSMVDPAYGLIACCVIIVYYQLDLYKSMIAIHRDTLLLEGMNKEIESFAFIGESEPIDNSANKLLESYTSRDSSIFSYTPFATLENYYESEWLRGGGRNGSSNKKELLDNFRKQYCNEKKQLKYKGGIVRTEMADHVFREIKFPNETAKCNPCEESCDFSIIEERLTREEGLRPASSKDLPVDWDKFFGHYLVKPIESIADDVYMFKDKVSEFLSKM
jgi:hypothetical protein